MKPLVSIGIPVYNGDDYLEKALASLQGQSYSKIEIIISDNASTDRTSQICRRFAEQDRRIRYFRYDKNSGAAWNFRNVFALARGEFFMWAAHDDLFDRTYVEKCLKILNEKPEIVLCYSWTILIDAHGQPMQNLKDDFRLQSVPPARRFQEIFKKMRLCNAAYGIIRSKNLARTPVHGNYVASDIPLLTELVLQGEFYEIPEYLFFRRIHANASAQANPTDATLIGHYDPAKVGKPVFRTWRHLYEHIRSVFRVQLSVPERHRCLVFLSKWAYYNHNFLIREVTELMRWRMQLVSDRLQNFTLSGERIL